MKFADSLVSMIGDFAAMKRTPDYKPQETPVSTKTGDENKESNSRRHSLNISIGTEEIPTIIPRRIRSESICVTTSEDSKMYNKTNRRVSAPCISIAASGALRRKLRKRKEGKSGSESDDETIRHDTLREEEEEDHLVQHTEKKASISSAVYRI